MESMIAGTFESLNRGDLRLNCISSTRRLLACLDSLGMGTQIPESHTDSWQLYAGVSPVGLMDSRQMHETVNSSLGSSNRSHSRVIDSFPPRTVIWRVGDMGEALFGSRQVFVQVQHLINSSLRNNLVTIIM